ncbi:MAG: glutaredoxin [Candidatus Thalassarchaeaceae archaeon]|nr:glutaredoxin [Candidatus Thalassarchaeaceae archaeon]
MPIWESPLGGKRKEAAILSQLHEIIEKADEDFLVFTQTVCPYCTRAFRILDSKGLTYSEVNLDNFEGLRKEVVMETGHRTVPVVFDMRGEEPIFVGGSDHLMEYL